jgi:type IX secretion system PorP/SprF family membrane protein
LHRFVKKYLSGLLLCMLAVGAARTGHAQQMAQYSQYMNNNYLLNPAVAGTEDYIDVKLSYRTQWVGIEGAPKTYYASVNSSLGRLRTQSKRTLHDWSRGFHAIGGLVYRDQTGPIARTALYGSYTYNLALTRSLRLALGVSVGMQQFSLDGSMLQFYNTSTTVANQASRVPDATVGLWLYNENFYAGVSSAQILGNQLDIAYDPGTRLLSPNKLERHYFLTGGVRLPLGEDVSLVPSVLVKYMRPAPVSVDVNAKIKFRDILWVGASYRVNDAFAGMAGINFSPVASLSYSYDAITSDLAGYQSGSHEVLLGLKLKKKQKAVCPDRFW